MTDTISAVIQALNRVVWGAPALLLILGVGLYFSLRTRFLQVRKLGFLIKLDTNGSQPEKLHALIDAGLVDMVAMDIKNSPAHYARTVGLPHFDLSPVRESAAMLMAGSLPFEFRTTVVDELHTQEDMTAIGQWLAGTENYYLQYFVDEDSVLRPGLHAPSKEKMQAFLQILRQTIPNAHIRGEEND